jgi:hypothetical protein
MLRNGPSCSTTQTGVATNHIMDNIRAGKTRRIKAKINATIMLIARPMMGKKRRKPTLKQSTRLTGRPRMS